MPEHRQGVEKSTGSSTILSAATFHTNRQRNMKHRINVRHRIATGFGSGTGTPKRFPATWLPGLVLFSFGWLAFAPVQIQAQEWTEFRGPQGKGTITGTEFPVAQLQDQVAWKTPIHGKGWSSPVVKDGKIWLTTATEDGTSMSVICVDQSNGKVLLDRVLHKNESPDFCHPTNSYASPTPVVEAGRAYIHFGKYGTTCLDTDTYEIVWQRTDLPCDHFRGPGSSPILYKDLLIVAFDGADQQYVVSMSRKTGETIWKSERQIDYGTENGDFKKAYGTATVFEVDGKPLLVYPSAIATIAYRPENGKSVWTLYHEGMNVSARPQWTPEGRLLITNGMGKMVCMDPNGSGDISQTHVKWRMAKGVSRKPTPLVIGDRFLMVNDKGVVSWYKTSNGESLWQKRVGGSFSASPVYDGHAVYLCSEQGKILAIEPADEYRLLGETQLAEGFKATPAITANALIFRSFGHLMAINPKR